jgi:two-component system, OmpR family, phosphate regulon response regulator PhoB
LTVLNDPTTLLQATAPVVLLVEDSDEIRMVAEVNLQAGGFHVLGVGGGEAALETLAEMRPDVIVLDVGLPDLSGFDVLDRVRELFPDLPVLLLTARWHEADRVQGFERGADDYLVKPFYVSELVARVRVLSRRSEQRRRQPELVFGDLSIDRTSRKVKVAGCDVELTAREFDLLCHLAHHPQQAFTRDDLLAAVWESSSEWQDASTVTEHVRRVRLKIEADPAQPRWITTVRGVGYRFEG